MKNDDNENPENQGQTKGRTLALYKMMSSLSVYENFVSRQNYRFRQAADLSAQGSYRMIKPYTEENVDLKINERYSWVVGIDTHFNALYLDLLVIGNLHQALPAPWEAFRGTFAVHASSIIFCQSRPDQEPLPEERPYNWEDKPDEFFKGINPSQHK